MSAKKKVKTGTSAITKQLKDVQEDGRFHIDSMDDITKCTIRVPDTIFFETYLQMFEDLNEFARRHHQSPEIVLVCTFPSNYPERPPWLRIVKPRFAFRTGHVTIGGSFCMYEMTDTGWDSNCSILNVLTFFVSNVIDGKGRIEPSSIANVPYTEEEAKQAHSRALSTHGW